MTRRTWNWIGIAALALVVAAGLAARQQALARSALALAAGREHHRELERLRAEHKRLVASQPTADELTALQADHAALEAMSAEVASLRSREPLPAKKSVSTRQDPKPVSGPVIPASAWKNAGRATPSDVLETALWAATAGEPEVLSQTLTFEADGRQRAEALFAGLSREAQARYVTPEGLVALMTIKDVPLGSMQVIATMVQGNGDQLLRVRLQSPEGAAKVTTVALRGHPGDWRLVVPLHAVEKYATQLAQ